MGIPVGSALRQRDKQYSAMRETNGSWYVLDTWHPSLEPLSPEDEIPMDSPSLTFLSEGAFHALITESTARGIIQHVLPAVGVDVEELQAIKVENLRLKKQVEELQESERKHEEVPTSESYKIKNKAMELLARLATSEDIKELSK